MSDRSEHFELAVRPGHPTGTNLVAYAGIALGFGLHAYPGHPTSTNLVARAEYYYQSSGAVAPPTFPTQYSGLRTYYHAAVQELCLVAAADGATGMGAIPMVSKNGVTYAIYLVETTDPNASPLYVRTSAGTKAVRVKT